MAAVCMERLGEAGLRAWGRRRDSVQRSCEEFVEQQFGSWVKRSRGWLKWLIPTTPRHGTTPARAMLAFEQFHHTAAGRAAVTDGIFVVTQLVSRLVFRNIVRVLNNIAQRRSLFNNPEANQSHEAVPFND